MRRFVAISHGLVFVIALAGLAQAGSGGALLPVGNTGTTNTRGIGGAMPAYYDGTLFTINFAELSPTAEATVLARNTQFNNIYQYDPGLPGGAPFVSVIDAITQDGPGFNPLWLETQLVFSAGVTPHQFTSDDQIRDAVTSGEITLAPTTEVYRCSVIGKVLPSTSATSSVSLAPVSATSSFSDPVPAGATWGQVKALYAR
jgi:hypothetical protein